MSSDSENVDEPAEDSPPPEASGIANIERTFLRLTFWQTLLSLAGVFTGAVALYAALNESQAVRDQTAASVWPYVQIIINDTDDGSSARFALSLENVGVGPARMRGMELRLNGEVVSSWDEATSRLLNESMQVGVDFGRSSVAKRVIGPGEGIVAFQTNHRELSLAMQEAVYGGNTSLRYCYCSIFDQCWLGSLSSDSESAGPVLVEACPDFGETAFLD